MHVFEATEADFQQQVLDASFEVPVLVDFWAAWCGPCRQLTPVLEAAVEARNGDVRLVKVDTDANPRLSATFGIRGIPNVKAFRDGRVVDEFTGAIPRSQVDLFLDALIPTAADRAVASGDEEALRAALAEEPRHLEARLALGRTLLRRGAADDAVEVLKERRARCRRRGAAGASRARRRPGRRPRGGGRDRDARRRSGGRDGAPDRGSSPSRRADRKDRLRRVMIGIFGERGNDDPLVQRYRRRLAAALY